MHGGMGFTWEFDCHLHYRRAKLTGLMLGSARRWKDLLDHAARSAGAGLGDASWTSTTPRKKRRSAPRCAQWLERQRRAQARRLRDLAEPLPGPRGRDGLERAKDFQRKKAEAGFAALHWPAEYGGRGLPPIYQVIYAQEESRFLVPRGYFEIGLGMCMPTLFAYAHRGAEAPLRRRRRCAARRSGASSSPSRAPAPTSPACARARVARRRRLGDQRPEDLDLGRALGGLGHPGRAQRSQGGQAQGPHLLLPRP